MAVPLQLLLIEDSDNDARLLLRLLRNGGYDVTHRRVETAQQMIAALKEQEWDLIVADYNMPRFSGLAALGLVRQRGIDTPFIVMSGQIGEEIAVSAMKAGAQDYIMKDNPARLLPTVERELREAQERRGRRRVEKALGQATERVARLQAITAALSRAVTEQEVARVIIEEGIAALDASAGLVALLTLDGTGIEILTTRGYESATVQASARIPLSLPYPLTDAVREGQPLWFSSLQRYEARYGADAARALARTGSQAAGALPLVVHGRVIGGIGLSFEHPREITDDDRTFAQTLAQHCAQALERAGLYESEREARIVAEAAEREVRDEAERLVAIVDAQREVATSRLDLPAIMQVIVDRARELTAADGAGIAMADGDSFQFRAGSGYIRPEVGKSWPLKGSLCGLCIRTGEVLSTNNTLEDPRVNQQLVRTLGSLSVVLVPLKDRDHVVGALHVGSAQLGSFDDRDVQTLQIMAGLFGSAMNDAREFEAKQALLTERTNALEALQQSEEGFRLLFAANPHPMWVYDRETLEFLEVNQAAIDQYGYTREAFLSMVLTDLMTEETRKNLTGNLAQHERVDRMRINARHRTSDGRFIDVEAKTHKLDFVGRPAVLSLIHDITDRRRTERRRAVQYAVSRILAESRSVEEAVAGALQTIGVGLEWEMGGFWSVDKEGGVLRCFDTWHIPSVNVLQFEAACRRAQVGPGAGLIGRVWQSGQPLWIENIDEDPNYQRFTSALNEGFRGGLAFPIRVGDQVLAVMDFFSHESRPPDEDLLQTVASLGNQIGQFIERKGAEAALFSTNERLQTALAELQHTQQQIVQQERLRALGEMASGVAHDLNNALQPIVGFSELLLMQGEQVQPEDLREYLTLIHTGARDAAAVVRGLRQLYRPRRDDDPYVAVDLNQIVQQTIVLTQPKWKDEALAHGATITVQPELGEVPAVTGSEAALREALTNLIFNAVDAMPHGGTITIRTSFDGETAALEVEDTGSGMPPGVQKRCRDPFFTTKGERGSGLGLSMVDLITQQHGGVLSINSAPNRGSRFVVRLPMPGPEPATASNSTTGPVGRLRILLVDDEGPIRDLLATYLTLDGHEVETAGNGQEGLDRLRADGADLILTDRAMPGMNGDQLAAAAKDADPKVRVIMLTGFGDILNSSGARPDGVDCVIGKPVTRAVLQETIARVVHRRSDETAA